MKDDFRVAKPIGTILPDEYESIEEISLDTVESIETQATIERLTAERDWFKSALNRMTSDHDRTTRLVADGYRFRAEVAFDRAEQHAALEQCLTALNAAFECVALKPATKKLVLSAIVASRETLAREAP